MLLLVFLRPVNLTGRKTPSCLLTKAPSTARSHLGTNHMFTFTPNQVEMQVKKLDNI